MGRAQGKHYGPRRPNDVPQIDPESPEGRQLGMSPRTQGVPSPIPGGRPHIQNAQTVRQRVPIADARPYITDLNAHGVPHGSATTRERAEIERGPNTIHRGDPTHWIREHDKPAPIPVYVVQDSHPAVLRTAAPHSFLVAANNANEPTRLCGRDLTRTAVLLLNEDASHNIRIAQRTTDLFGTTLAAGTLVGGAILPKGMTSYFRLDTQDELYAMADDTGTPRISIIQVFERVL